MLQSYKSLSDESKVLIFPGSRKFYPNELAGLQEKLEGFCQKLSGIELGYELKYNRFIVFVISDQTPMDLDRHNELIGFVQELETTFDMVLLDKVNVCFKQGEYVQLKEIPDFKALIKNKGVSKKTIVFDHMINTKQEYETVWELPAGESWLAHYF